MKHLALLGSGPRLLQLAGHLQSTGFIVTLLPKASTSPHTVPTASSAPKLVVVEAADTDELTELASTVRDTDLPWLALCGEPAKDSAAILDAHELTSAAYRAGAFAVLPAGFDTELVVQTVEQAMASLSPGSPKAAEGLQRRRFHAGDSISLRVGEMLKVQEGIIAQEAWHDDGAESLIGLWGPGCLLLGHPQDACCLSFRAHTEVVVETGRLTNTGDVLERLSEQVQRLEAWSSVQSRQNMEKRLLGVLALLAEQFGDEHGDGTVINVRVTHAQLAAAIGATRATVTRLLGPLRRRGQISTVHSTQGELYCLPQSGGSACSHKPLAFQGQQETVAV